MSPSPSACLLPQTFHLGSMLLLITTRGGSTQTKCASHLPLSKRTDDNCPELKGEVTGLNWPPVIAGTIHVTVLTSPPQTFSCLAYTREIAPFPKAKHVPLSVSCQRENLHHLNIGEGQPRRLHFYDHSPAETTIICKSQTAKKRKTTGVFQALRIKNNTPFLNHGSLMRLLYLFTVNLLH